MKNDLKWTKLGLLVGPDPKIEWLAGGSGPCCAISNIKDTSIVDLYVSGRDSQNRSRLGLARFSLKSETIVDICETSVLTLGTRGAFDENGTSYPSVVRDGCRVLMYYTGWIKGVHVPWYNDLGLATSLNGLSFERISRAPVMPRGDLDDAAAQFRIGVFVRHHLEAAAGDRLQDFLADGRLVEPLSKQIDFIKRASCSYHIN